MKKTLLFLMLVFAVSITAQNKEQKSSKQPPATNEFLRNPSTLQQRLRVDKNAPQSKETGAQHKIKKTEAAGITWNDIGTINSWTETIRFDPENTDLIPIEFVDEYGYTTNTLCYAVKFTLAQDELVSAMSSSASNDFTLYADPEAQQEIMWGYYLLQPLKAGVYYLLIGECGNLQWVTPFDATIKLSAAPVATISLSYQQSVSITKENSALIVNTYYALFYKFTLAEDAVVSFGSDFDEALMGEHMSFFELDLITDKYMINATNSDIPLEAGTYYIAAYAIFWDDNAFWETHASVEAQLDIQIKTLDVPVALSIPFEQDFSLKPSNAYNFFSYYSVLYSLHLDDNQMIEIDTDNQWSVIIYEKGTWKYIKGFYPEESAIVQLSAGDYYVAIADYNHLYDGETPLDGHLTIGIPLNYATLDFSETIAVGETKVGDDASLVGVITEISDYMGIQQEKVAAYHFTAQAGRIYKFVMECYVKALYTQPTLSLFRTPNTGDIYADVIRGAMPYINASSGTGSLTWQSDVDGDVNVMFFFESPASDVMFKLTLNEIEATHTDTQGTSPAYEDITLPFVSNLHFTPDYNAYWDESASEYYKLYKLTLTEKTSLTMESGSNPKQGVNIYLKMFSDEARTNQVGNSWGYGEGSGSLLLEAGTYYLILTDNGYFNSIGKYAECLVEMSGSTDFEEVITVAQLMDDPTIPVINYAADLPYTDSGYFVYGTSKLVNAPDAYLTNVFAKGYKLTGMNEDDEVHIVDRQPENEYESQLVVYQKEANGTYTQLAQNSSDRDEPFSGATHIKFTAPASRDYYIMASTSSSYPGLYGNVKYPGYRVAIWTGTADDEPVTGALQLPDEILIASTATNASEVYLDEEASSVDIKLALMALEITATTQAGATIALKNNPFSWEINDLVTEASFVVIPIPYLPAETYAPATIQLKIKAGIDGVTSETICLANSGNGLVTILGLQGKETISLIDINGRILRKTTAQGTTATIETNALPRGVYIVAVQNDKELTVLKFVR